jgi:hypothetical protein
LATFGATSVSARGTIDEPGTATSVAPAVAPTVARLLPAVKRDRRLLNRLPAKEACGRQLERDCFRVHERPFFVYKEMAVFVKLLRC